MAEGKKHPYSWHIARIGDDVLLDGDKATVVKLGRLYVGLRRLDGSKTQRKYEEVEIWPKLASKKALK